MWIYSFPKTICWRHSPFPSNGGLGTLVKDHLTVYERVYFWAVYFIPFNLFTCSIMLTIYWWWMIPCIPQLTLQWVWSQSNNFHRSVRKFGYSKTCVLKPLLSTAPWLFWVQFLLITSFSFCGSHFSFFMIIKGFVCFFTKYCHFG